MEDPEEKELCVLCVFFFVYFVVHFIFNSPTLSFGHLPIIIGTSSPRRGIHSSQQGEALQHEVLLVFYFV
jgi:hypothetical protein